MIFFSRLLFANILLVSLCLLINKKIKGAAIDVVDNDSSWESNEIIRNPTLEYASNHDNLIISPHMGGYGKDSINRTREFVTELFLKDIK